MEEVKSTRPLMTEEEFKDNLNKAKEQMYENVQNGILMLRDYTCIRKCRSARRALKRGHISVFGDIYPSKPFNNRSNRNNSRQQNELKKSIYVGLKKTQHK